MGIKQEVTVIEAQSYNWDAGTVYINTQGNELALSLKEAKKFRKELDAAIEIAKQGDN